jgi:hypothetical protein
MNMKRIFGFIFLVTVMAVWCTPSFADPAREGDAGAGPFLMGAVGGTGGVDMEL